MTSTVQIVLGVLAAAAPAAPAAQEDYAPEIAPDTGEAAKALAAIKVADGFKVELFAAEPFCANLVALALDEQGRCYLVETFRRDRQVLDIREHLDWLEDDMACRTVADRVAMIHRHEGEKASLYLKEHERVRLLVDRDGDGRADEATVFADGFNDYADGVAAGVLARRGDVWFADIPNLWRLRDTDGDGRADEREVLATGFGVHFNYVGHDLHGLRIGPDGRLWFSIGDRGLNVVTQEGRHLELPDTGAVLRCELDGSDLELIHTGLRNPQELAFNDVGDLFTVDNNSDSGDRARLVHVVEGGESGWSVGWQWIGGATPRGPWNREKMWHPRNDEQPAFILPCIENLVAGPSGLAHYPGTGFPARYRDNFFICDFEAQPDNTRVVAFTVAPEGAGYELATQEDFVARGIVATDCDFGPDGALWISDWVGGWVQTKKGRVWRVFAPEGRARELVAETGRLIAEVAGGFAQRTAAELAALLAHADQRVRQEAQFALAERGAAGVEALVEVATREGSNPGARSEEASRDVLARLHAIWGLGQVARRDPAALPALLRLAADPVAEVRAQVAKVLGDTKEAAAVPRLRKLVLDPVPRVRFFAALSLGRLRAREAIGDLVLALRENDDRDLTLRHAFVMGLAGCARDRDGLATLGRDGSPAVRMGALLALRKQSSPHVLAFLDDAQRQLIAAAPRALADFLHDADPRLVVEAARAVYDLPIPSGMEALAIHLLRRGLTSLPLLLRAVHANFRLGQELNARQLASFVLRTDVPEAARVEALQALREFDTNPPRDRFLGVHRPYGPGRAPAAVAATGPILRELLTAGPEALCKEAARFIGSHRLGGYSAELAGLVTQAPLSAGVRVAALEALTELRDPALRGSIEAALEDPSERLRGAARRSLARIDPGLALAILARALEEGGRVERQEAFATLAEMSDPGATAQLHRWMDRLLEDGVAPELVLDLLVAAVKKDDATLKPKVAAFEAARRADDPLAKWRECLVGGDAERGRRLFHERDELQCLKCHKVAGQGAGEAGPDLAGIGAKKARDYLLEAIALPNQQIADDFRSTILFLKSGDIVDGRVLGETPTHFRIYTNEKGAIEVARADVDSTRQGMSAMLPDLLTKMSKPELRDLIEYLASLKEPSPPPPPAPAGSSGTKR